jgi:hypothetical protein
MMALQRVTADMLSDWDAHKATMYVLQLLLVSPALSFPSPPPLTNLIPFLKKPIFLLHPARAPHRETVLKSPADGPNGTSAPPPH